MYNVKVGAPLKVQDDKGQDVLEVKFYILDENLKLVKGDKLQFPLVITPDQIQLLISIYIQAMYEKDRGVQITNVDEVKQFVQAFGDSPRSAIINSNPINDGISQNPS